MSSSSSEIQSRPEAATGPADVSRLVQAVSRITQQLSQVIVGQERVIEQMLMALLSGGHCLLVGVPGLAKTLMVRTLAETLNLSFSRVQFTPDLLPADITGTDVIQEDKATGTRDFKFLPGPVFAHVVLADEINRTPPKTQAALLEAMQEQQVTASGKRHKLPDPFFVLATQNPIEQEGTYPLPEAQLDRFMFEIFVDYPSEDEEFAIVRRTTTGVTPRVHAVLTQEEILALREFVRGVPVADHIIHYALQLARLTRKQTGDIPDFIRDFVNWGAGPRASQYLILGAKARAVLQGRSSVAIEDVQSVAYPVLRHRIMTNFNAEAEGVTTDELIRRLIELVPADSAKVSAGGKFPPIFKS